MIQKTLFILTLSLSIVTLTAQKKEFEIRVNKNDAQGINVINKGEKEFETPVKSLFIKCITAGQGETKFKLFFDGKECNIFKGNEGKDLTCTGTNDLRDKKIEIKDAAGTTTEFEFTLRAKRIFEIKFTQGSQQSVQFDKEGNSDELTGAVPKLFITLKEPVDPTGKYTVRVGDRECTTFTGDKKDAEINCTTLADLRGQSITITNPDGSFQYFSFFLKKKTGQADDLKGIPVKLSSAIQEIKSKFPRIAVTTYGLQVPAGNNNTVYTGSKYVHIFLDQFGNNVFSTIPQGVANRQYIVHVFYLENENDPNQIDYSINQTAGEFQETLVFNNSGQLNFELRAADEKDVPIKYRWAHKEFLLSTSTINIQFEVVRTAVKDQNAQKQEFENQTLKSYTIKMSKVYHGSFDVGLINTTLENPTFELLTSPTNPAESVVKKNEGHNRGVVTAMATFYTSPIILLEQLFGARNFPNYMLSGRNFLEDHKIYERIYPAVGVGFTDKTLENLFFGFNWEFARGGSIFMGWHYGKVNIYNAPDGFNFEETPVTTDEFNLKKNTEWKTKFAIGLNLDIMIIRNLFSGGSASASSAEN